MKKKEYKINLYDALSLIILFIIITAYSCIYMLDMPMYNKFIPSDRPVLATEIILFGLICVCNILSIYERKISKHTNPILKAHNKKIYSMLHYNFKDKNIIDNPKVNIPISIHKRSFYWSIDRLTIKQFPTVKNLKDQIRYKYTDEILFNKRTLNIYLRSLKEPTLYQQSINSDIWFLSVIIKDTKYFAYLTDNDIKYIPVNKVRHILIPDSEITGQILKYTIETKNKYGSPITDDIYYVLIPASKFAYKHSIYKNTTHYICTKNEFNPYKQFIIGEEYINPKLLK